MLEGLYQWGTFIYFSANCDAMVVLVLGPCEGAYDDTTLTDLAAASVLPGLAWLIQFNIIMFNPAPLPDKP